MIKKIFRYFVETSYYLACFILTVFCLRSLRKKLSFIYSTILRGCYL